MTEPIPSECFTCQNPVHEFDDNQFGCDHCKAIWIYKDGKWIDTTKKRMRKEKREANGRTT